MGRVATIAVAVAIGVAVVLPVVAAGLAALGQAWRPTGDWAVLTLRVRDVGEATPLVGPYSRFGWNHPGPLMYWLLAGPFRALGGGDAAMLASAALINAVAVAGALLVAWRRGGLALVALVAAATALLAHAMGPELLRDPWNPYLTLLPLALFVLLSWSVAEGDRWTWPAAVFVGSFEVQSHVGYAVVVAAVAATAVIIAVARRRQVPVLPMDPSRRRALLVVTAVVAVVCWAPVLVDEVAGTGNLTDIARYFLGGNGDSPAGATVALGQAALHLQVPGAPWLGAFEQAGADGALLGGRVSALVVPVLVFALALLAAGATRAWSAVRLQTIVGVTAVAGVIATSRVTGPLFAYIARWWWVVALLWWVSIVWSIVSAIRRWGVLPSRLRRATPLALTAVAVVVVVLAVRPTVDAIDAAEVPDPSATLILDELLPDTMSALDGSGPVIVDSAGSVWGTLADGVRLALERHGIPVATDPADAFRLGQQRSSDRRVPESTVWVVSADAATEWSYRPDLRLLARWDPLEPADRLAYLVEEHRLQEQLVAAGRPDLAHALATGGGGVDTEAVGLAGVDQDLVRSVEAVRRRGDPVAIFLGPAPDEGPSAN